MPEMVVNVILTEPLEKYVPPKNVPIMPEMVVFAYLTEQNTIRIGLEKYVPPRNVPI